MAQRVFLKNVLPVARMRSDKILVPLVERGWLDEKRNISDPKLHVFHMFPILWSKTGLFQGREKFRPEKVMPSDWRVRAGSPLASRKRVVLLHRGLTLGEILGKQVNLILS